MTTATATVPVAREPGSSARPSSAALHCGARPGAPMRVNLIQAGFLDAALATSYFANEAAVEATGGRQCVA
jgi:hypothetical protein